MHSVGSGSHACQEDQTTPANPSRESDIVRLARFGTFVIPRNGTARGYSWYGIGGVDRVVEAHFDDTDNRSRYNTVVTSRLFDPSAEGVTNDDARSRVRASLLNFASQQLANERLGSGTGNTAVNLEDLRLEMNEERAHLEELNLVDCTFSLDDEQLPCLELDLGETHLLGTLAEGAIVMVAGGTEFVSSNFIWTTQPAGPGSAP